MVSADGCCSQQHPVTDFHDLPTRPPAFFLRCDIRLEDKEWSGPEPVPALGVSFRASALDALLPLTPQRIGRPTGPKADTRFRAARGVQYQFRTLGDHWPRSAFAYTADDEHSHKLHKLSPEHSNSPQQRFVEPRGQLGREPRQGISPSFCLSHRPNRDRRKFSTARAVFAPTSHEVVHYTGRVESRCRAAVDPAYLFPPLSSGGASLAVSWSH
jgi:hypothetical protein